MKLKVHAQADPNAILSFYGRAFVAAIASGKHSAAADTIARDAIRFHQGFCGDLQESHKQAVYLSHVESVLAAMFNASASSGEERTEYVNLVWYPDQKQIDVDNFEDTGHIWCSLEFAPCVHWDSVVDDTIGTIAEAAGLDDPNEIGYEGYDPFNDTMPCFRFLLKNRNWPEPAAKTVAETTPGVAA